MDGKYTKLRLIYEKNLNFFNIIKFKKIIDLKSSWRVPYIVYFCNLFSSRLDLIDIGVEVIRNYTFLFRLNI